MYPYCLYPAISGNQIAFVSEDDLWTYSLEDRTVMRLVSNIGVISRPSFSRDGKWLAFRSLRRGGPPVTEVFVIPSDGGLLKQLTYLGSANTDIAGWTPDGRIVISTDVETPFRAETELYTVGLEGGYLEPMNLGPASSILYADHTLFLGRNTHELMNWKRYRGGTRGKIWVSGDGKTFSKFLELETGVTSPMIAEGRFYFISDHEGTGNIYSVDFHGGDMKRHTDFNDYYVRNASSDGKKIVFHSGGDLYILDIATSKVSKLELELPNSGLKRNERFVENGKFMTEFAIDREGDMVAFVIRGRLFAMGNWEGPVFPVEFGGPGRARLCSFLGDGDRMIGVTDFGGSDSIFVHTLRNGNSELVKHDFGLIEALTPEPGGKRALAANNRFELFLIDLEKRSVTQIDRSEAGIISDLTWHPDGRHAAYTFPTMSRRSVVVIADTESGNKRNVTTEGSIDTSPVFDPKGKYLYYLSQRTLDPVYDKFVFDLGYPAAAKPYAVRLRRDLPSLFRPVPKMLREKESEEKGVEMDGMEERSEPFPVQAGDYTKILAAEDRVLFLKFPVEGSMKYWSLSKTTRENGELDGYNLDERKTYTAVSGISDAQLSGNAKRILVTGDARFRIIDSTKADEKLAPGEEPSKATGYIDTERIKCLIEPEKEWKQMFREAWVLMKENYWNPNRVGKEWDAVFTRYGKLLDRLGSRRELSDLISEVQGELGTSHAYEIGADVSQDNSYRVGRLGAKLKFNGTGYEILKIYRGDPSNEDEKSPLLACSVPLAVGDVITSIAGRRLSETMTPERALLNILHEDVLLVVRTRDGEKVASVMTLADDGSLRYRSWVEEKRKFVHERTEGRVGYIHVPDMGPSGFNEFHRMLAEESSKEGLIVDVRHNGGGHVSELLLEKLVRRIIGFDRPRKGRLERYPQYSVNGPIVAVTDENAGSDGDIFSHSFKLYRIGPLIGTRTWGGVVGIDPRHDLVDGTVITQPQFAFWFKDVGWGVENYGTDPTIQVEFPPHDHTLGNDPQLQRAIDECLSLIANNGRFLEEPKLP